MPTGKEFMYEKIYNDLLDGIENQTYQVGSRLPSEKELAKMYDVSRITSKKALELLAEQGRILRKPGRGSFVLPPNLGPEVEDGLPKTPFRLYQTEKVPKMLGVILDSFSNDFGSDLLKSIEQECRKRNYNMILRCTDGSIEEENRAIGCAVELGAQGLILMCAQDESYNTTIIKLALNHFPMVLVDRQMQGISIPCIKTDNYQAARDLTKRLIEKGHKKLCFVSHSSVGTPTVRERYEGFVDCIVEYEGANGRMAEIAGYNPVPQDEAKEYTNYDYAELRKLIQANEDCSAFLAVEYKLSILLYQAMRELGIEREIVSFDGLDSIYNEQPFLHAKQDERLMGRKAVETIDDIVHGKVVKGNICVPYQIVEGKK